MTKGLAALAFVFALTVAPHADALPATCLSLPLPTTALTPSYSIDLFFLGDHTSAKVWRQPCQDGSGQTAVLLRMTPVTSGPFVCWTMAIIVQNGIQRNGMLATSTAGLSVQTFCGDVFVPTTVVLLSGPGQPDYDEVAAFTLIYNGSPVTSAEIPAAASPPPAGPPTLTVHATGCTTCHAGNTLGFELHVTNPGGPMLVELKTGARLPDGSVVSILGRHEEELLPTGVTVIPLFYGFVLPAGTPAGAYAIEAALLEPELGVTISRSSVALTLGP